MSKGYIILHRQLQDHWMWQTSEPMTIREAWITILFKVNHCDNKVFVKGALYECKRGQSVMSIDSWCKLFNWQRGRVRSFFRSLQNDGMILINGSKYTTMLTVCNYDRYQRFEPTENQLTTNSSPTDNQLTTNSTPSDNQLRNTNNTLNNENTLNKGKKKKPTPPIEKTQYLDSVFLKEDEYSKLIEKHGEADVKLMLEKLNWWKLDKQTEAQQKSGSDYAKINGWVSKWLSDEKAKIGRVNEKLNAAPAPKPSNAVEVMGDYSRTSF